MLSPMMLPNGRETSFPRYRVEERQPDLAAFIVGFADAPFQYQTLLALHAAHLTRARAQAELGVVDQDSEAIVLRRDVPGLPEPRPRLP
jgi:hypothetical protein